MRRYYRRLPTLRGLDPNDSDENQHCQLRGYKKTSYRVTIGKIRLISQHGYLLLISLNAKVVCPKILKGKWVSLVPSAHSVSDTIAKMTTSGSFP